MRCEHEGEREEMLVCVASTRIPAGRVLASAGELCFVCVFEPHALCAEYNVSEPRACVRSTMFCVYKQCVPKSLGVHQCDDIQSI